MTLTAERALVRPVSPPSLVGGAVRALPHLTAWLLDRLVRR